MKQKVNLVVLLDLIFLLMLGLAGSAPEDSKIMNFLYYGAFIIPFMIGSSYLAKYHPSDEFNANIRLDINRAGVKLSMPLVFPIVAGICAVAFITNILMGLFGLSNEISYDENLFTAILLHAAIPAVLEEMLFRYIPLNLISENKRFAIIISSILFAFAHMNLFSIPYALFAGLALGSVTLLTKSILPAILIHFINNLFSLFSLYEFNPIILYSILGFMTILSIIVVISKRKDYIITIKNVFAQDQTPELCYSPFIFMGISALIIISGFILK